MVKHTLKIWWCWNRKIFKVCLAIFQHYAWKFNNLTTNWITSRFFIIINELIPKYYGFLKWLSVGQRVLVQKFHKPICKSSFSFTIQFSIVRQAIRQATALKLKIHNKFRQINNRLGVSISFRLKEKSQFNWKRLWNYNNLKNQLSRALTDKSYFCFNKFWTSSYVLLNYILRDFQNIESISLGALPSLLVTSTSPLLPSTNSKHQK